MSVFVFPFQFHSDIQWIIGARIWDSFIKIDFNIPTNYVELIRVGNKELESYNIQIFPIFFTFSWIIDGFYYVNYILQINVDSNCTWVVIYPQKEVIAIITRIIRAETVVR